MASTYSLPFLEEAYAAGIRSFENEDFSYKDLRGLSVVDVTFVNCNFENSVLDHAVLNGCKFIYCNLKFTRFEEADLSDCLVEECDFEDTSFVCANLIGTKLEGVNKYKANFQGALFEEKDMLTSLFAFPIAFQSWDNGGKQISSIHYSNRYNDGVSEFDSFVAKHETSNTFATLHICNNMEEWNKVYEELFGGENVAVDEDVVNVIYGNIEGATLNGWSSEPSDIYDTPISVTYSHYEECNDSGSPDHKGWNVYNSAYGEVYICV